MKSSVLNPYRLILLGSSVLMVFIISLLPFLSTLPQLFSRLFPFGRGLTHAYWAPNIWALYNFTDLLLSFVFKGKSNSEYTKGMVGVYNHEVLPNITPGISLVCAVGASLAVGYIIWKHKGISFTWACVMSCWSFFMFGWHVHEKAVLMFWIPMILIEEMDSLRIWEVNTISCYCLLPLIFHPLGKIHLEQPTLILIFLLSTLMSYSILKPSLSSLHKLSLFLSGFLYLFYLFFNKLRGQETFLPLMLISVIFPQVFSSSLFLYLYIQTLRKPIVLIKLNHNL